MSQSTKLTELYRAIPTFSCREGCSDCCGAVPMAKPEWQRIKLAKRAAGQDCLSCDYLVDNRCSIYADRPFLCRLFGATEDATMACPHGCGPAKPLTARQAHVLTEKYRRLMGGDPAAYTIDVGQVLAQHQAGALLQPSPGPGGAVATLVRAVAALGKAAAAD